VLAAAGDPFSGARERMVKDQIESRGIRNRDVLRAMRQIPRHLFVPAELQLSAYLDVALPIGHGATISQPYVIAWMTELLQPGSTQRVLEIGTGSGYQAAVLCQVAGSVYTMEIVPELAHAAEKRLADLGYHNITVRIGDGYKGWPEKAPFDRIILTAAPEKVPKTLLDELAAGGRLVAPVGPAFDQKLTVVDKSRTGAVREQSVGDVGFVPMVPQ
jgi:protein-L-isoaspartate(D-aspartate) O-methyltransferase